MWNVLVADDETYIREGLTKLIPWEKYGFKVQGVYANGKELLEGIKTLSPQLVIVDIKMPFFSGLDVARYIREHELDTNVIILTAYAEFEYAKEAISYRVHHYIVKNNMFDEIPEALEEIQNMLLNKENVSAEDFDNEKDDIIVKIKTFVKENYHTRISLEELCKDMSLNPSYVSRLFKQKTGENFIDYVNKYKVERAKYYFNNTNKKVYEIAEMVGIEDTAYFSRVFKKYTGQSPKEYTDNQENGR